MTKPDKGTAASASIYVRVTWGAYGLNFTVNSTDTPKLNCHDKHQTIVEVAPFDSEKHVTTHPVQLTCTATGHFTLSRSLDEAFNLLAIDQLPKGSKSEDKLPKESSYSIPYDLYPRNVQIFMSETFRLYMNVRLGSGVYCGGVLALSARMLFSKRFLPASGPGMVIHRGARLPLN